MSIQSLHDLYEGMSDEEFADAQEKERLENHPERDKIKAIQALLAKEKGMKEDLLSKDGDNEDNVDNIDKVASPSAKGKGYDSAVAAQSKESGDEMKQITQTTKPMYEDLNLASIAKKLGIDMDDLKDKIEKMKSREKDEIEASARASMAENTRLSNEVSDRIEGLLNQPMKKKFMDVGMDLVQDLLEEDPFDIDDVIQHLANELGAYMDDFYKEGEKLNSIEIGENGHVEDYADEIKEDDIEENDQKRYEDAAAKMLKDRVLKDIPMDIIVDFVKTHGSDIRRMNNSEIKDEFEEFRSVNYDYIDEDLRSHFNRFK